MRTKTFGVGFSEFRHKCHESKYAVGISFVWRDLHVRREYRVTLTDAHYRKLPNARRPDLTGAVRRNRRSQFINFIRLYPSRRQFDGLVVWRPRLVRARSNAFSCTKFESGLAFIVPGRRTKRNVSPYTARGRRGLAKEILRFVFPFFRRTTSYTSTGIFDACIAFTGSFRCSKTVNVSSVQNTFRPVSSETTTGVDQKFVSA